MQAIRKTVVGSQHFLSHLETLARMQTNYLYLEITKRMNPSSWTQKAKLEVARILVFDELDHVLADGHRNICKKIPIYLKL